MIFSICREMFRKPKGVVGGMEKMDLSWYADRRLSCSYLFIAPGRAGRQRLSSQLGGKLQPAALPPTDIVENAPFEVDSWYV